MPWKDKERRREHFRGWRGRRISVGLCAWCGGEKGEGGTQTLCGPCAERHRKGERSESLRKGETGECVRRGCSKTKIPGSCYCEKHRSMDAQSRRKRLYGLSQERYEALLTLQEGNCAWCRESMDTSVVDHDHATGRVRGLVHNRCNIEIGIIEKNLARLDRVLEYLQQGGDPRILSLDLKTGSARSGVP